MRGGRRWKCRIEQPANHAANSQALGGRVALEPWLIAVACLLLVMEMFLAHWMCPRMNPALSAVAPSPSRLCRSAEGAGESPRP